MRKTIFILLLVVSAMGLWAQQTAVTNAMKAGDATSLGALSDANIDLTIEATEGTYSKQQATVLLRNFFATHKVSSYVVVHEGSSGAGSVFQIGNLVTAAGGYKVYIYSKLNGASVLIQEIKFEKA